VEVDTTKWTLDGDHEVQTTEERRRYMRVSRSEPRCDVLGGGLGCGGEDDGDDVIIIIVIIIVIHYYILLLVLRSSLPYGVPFYEWVVYIA
jgi:uncharacterized protein (DUF983 family)